MTLRGFGRVVALTVAMTAAGWGLFVVGVLAIQGVLALVRLTL